MSGPTDEARAATQTEMAMSPCVACAEPIPLEASVCRRFGTGQIVDVFVRRKLVDKRKLYQLSRELASALPGVEFESLKSALSEGKRLLQAATRRELVSAREISSRFDVELEVRQMSEKKPPPLTWVVSALAGGLILLGGVAFFFFPKSESSNQEQMPIASIAKGGAELSRELLHSVVVVHCGEGIGTGFVVGVGRVITNDHVVDCDGPITLRTHAGDELSAAVEKRDEILDVALLSTTGALGPAVSLGDAASLATGETVYVVGTPAGLDFTVSRGIVSHPARFVEGNAFVQTDASVNPGNSGGPLANERGEVVGLVTLKARAEGIAYALPVNYLFLKTDDGFLVPPRGYDDSKWQKVRQDTDRRVEEEIVKFKSLEGQLLPVGASRMLQGRAVGVTVVSVGSRPGPRMVDLLVESSRGEVCNAMVDVEIWLSMPDQVLDRANERTRAWVRRASGLEVFTTLAVVSTQDCPEEIVGDARAVLAPSAPKEFQRTELRN